MAAYPVFDVNTLSNFSGRAVSEYTNTGYVTSAINQATLLFKLGTCLGESFPDDPTLAALASMAINAMADAFYSVQPFNAVLANPFSSETIGSYSYSKVSGAVMGGLPTGITWFDIAISKLSRCDFDGIPIGGGIEAFEWDGVFTGGVVPGNIRLLGPQDLDAHYAYSHDPSEGGTGAPMPGVTGYSTGDDVLDDGEL